MQYLVLKELVKNKIHENPFPNASQPKYLHSNNFNSRERKTLWRLIYDIIHTVRSEANTIHIQLAFDPEFFELKCITTQPH